MGVLVLRPGRPGRRQARHPTGSPTAASPGPTTTSPGVDWVLLEDSDDGYDLYGDGTLRMWQTPGTAPATSRSRSGCRTRFRPAHGGRCLHDGPLNEKAPCSTACASTPSQARCDRGTRPRPRAWPSFEPQAPGRLLLTDAPMEKARCRPDARPLDPRDPRPSWTGVWRRASVSWQALPHPGARGAAPARAPGRGALQAQSRRAPGARARPRGGLACACCSKSRPPTCARC